VSPLHPLRSSASKSDSVAGHQHERHDVAPNAASAVHRAVSNSNHASRFRDAVRESASDDNRESRPRGGRVQGAAGAAPQRGQSAAEPLDATEHGGTMSLRRRPIPSSLIWSSWRPFRRRPKTSFPESPTPTPD